MRYIIRNNHDCDGITESIISELEKKHNIEHGFVFDYGENSRNRNQNVTYFSASYCYSHLVSEMEAIYEPISRDILELMLPYKSMALHIAMRECHFNVYKYEYLEQLYYKELHYWNHFLDEEKIDFVLFMISPHHIGEYVLYALAQCKMIPTMIMIPIMPEGYYVLGNTMEDAGRSIEEKYQELCKCDKDVIKYNRDFQQYYDNIFAKETVSKDEKKKTIAATKRLLEKNVNVKEIMMHLARMVLIPFLPQYKNKRQYRLLQERHWLGVCLNARLHELKMDTIQEYKKYSILPDYNDKYIYFALQLQPEETTMPRAGEYKNQFLAIETLAKGAEKNGVKIYVKEHWVQYHRERGYYSRLSKIPNVYLIDIDINSCDLIENALAVSTQTGTCMVEGMLYGKNVLYFGEGTAFKGIPGSFLISSANQVNDIIRSIEDGYCKVNVHDAKRYLKALEMESVACYCDSLEERPTSYDKGETAKKIVNYIETNLYATKGENR